MIVSEIFGYVYVCFRESTVLESFLFYQWPKKKINQTQSKCELVGKKLLAIQSIDVLGNVTLQ